MPYLSHPDRLLREHLQEVAESARAGLDHPALRHRELLRAVASLLGLTHDFGKYTFFFQKHLRAEERNTEPRARHAFPSAVFTAWLVQQRLETLPDTPEKPFLPLLAYLCVLRHHGHLRDPEELLPPPNTFRNWPQVMPSAGSLSTSVRYLPTQLADLASRERIVCELAELGIPEAATFLQEMPVFEIFRELDRLHYRLIQPEFSQEIGARLAIWGQLLFSSLIDADKFSAARLERPIRPDIPGDVVDRYLQYQFPEPRHELDQQRKAFYECIQQQVEEAPLEELAGRLLSLTAPTGLGKTLTALSAALHLRERLGDVWTVSPRIVYALPFVNIIEQNYDVFQRVLSFHLDRAEPPQSYLLRHHHLADVVYREDDSQEHSVEDALLLTEAWESEIVVTTFVQLAHTILGYRNRFLKKFHNLIGSILILDEPQALPMEYWSLLGHDFQLLARELGTTVIQMTATRPLILQNARELHPDPEPLFRVQQRTHMDIDLTERELKAFAEEIPDWIERHGSLLIVVNTVRTSLQLYRHLAEMGLGTSWQADLDSIPALIYLSTNITPRQRRQRVEGIRDRLDRNWPTIVVSTQVIEAGVDVDFPAVVRDLGPLDAIVQVAGRCNREGRRESGQVYVRHLAGSGAAHVYGKLHLYMAKKLLESYRTLSEPEYFARVEAYFHEVVARASSEVSDTLWQAFLRLRYETDRAVSLSEFHLIPPQEQVSIFVAEEAADESWFLEQFGPEVLDEQDINERRQAYLRHRRRLHEGLLQIASRRALLNLPPAAFEEKSLRWIPHRQLDEYYDSDTGFRWEGIEEEAWVI